MQLGRYLIALFLLASVTHAWWNPFKKFRKAYKNSFCPWSGCHNAKRVQPNAPMTNQGNCAIAPLSDIKDSDHKYTFKPTDRDERTSNNIGFRVSLDEFDDSPEKHMNFIGGVNYNGTITLLNRRLQTELQWKHLIYHFILHPVLDHTHQPSHNIAFYLDGEGFCTYQIPGFDGNHYFTDEDPFDEATLIWKP